MTMHRNQFIGTWEIVQGTPGEEYISIEENKATKEFTVKIQDGNAGWKPYGGDGGGDFTFYREDGFLIHKSRLTGDPSHAIFPWRNKNIDMLVFRTTQHGEPAVHFGPSNVLSVRRVSWEPEDRPGKVSDEPPPIDNEIFTITVSTDGHNMPKPGNQVFIRTLRASKIPGFVGEPPEGVDFGIYGIFYKEPESKPVLYDVLVYDIDNQTFKSVFGVRSVSIDHSENETDRGGATQIFAAFESQRTMPEGYSGNILGRVVSAKDSQSNSNDSLSHNLSAHMPFEVGLPGDPDSGCWGGGGG